MNPIFAAAAAVVLLAFTGTARPPEVTVPADKAKANLQDDARVAPGIRIRVYDIDAPMDQLLTVAPDQTPNWEEIKPSLDLNEGDLGELNSDFRTTAFATLHIAEEGQYEFKLIGDDGVALFIDDEAVIVFDGYHAADPVTETIKLDPGEHNLRVEHFQGAGPWKLRLEWKTPGDDDFKLLTGDAITVDPTLTPVVSSGQKRLLRDVQMLRSGDRAPVEGVHPSFGLATIRPEGFEPQVGGLAVLPDGRLVVSDFAPANNGAMETEPNGTLYVLDGVQDVTPEDGASGPDKVKVIKAAENLWDPAGMVFTDGRLIVAETEALTEFIDEDGDSVFETRKTVADGWISDNYHHFTFGPVADPDDPEIVYIALSSAVYLTLNKDEDGNQLLPLNDAPVIGLNGPNPPNRCSVAKVDLRTGEMEFIAGGFRTPNAMVIGPGGQLFVGENQGAWAPASELNHIKPGHFYGFAADLRPWPHYPEGGSPAPFQDEPTTPPALYLPQNQINNSPTEPVMIPDLETFGPYAGQMLIGELTMGGIRRASLEEAGGWYQGAVFRFSQGFEGGVNRLEFAPDGSLYVGMTGYAGNWTWRDTTFGLQKLVPTGQIAFEMLDMSATPDGFELTFTKPADKEDLADLNNYRLSTWTYAPTGDYGGPDIDKHSLEVTAADVSEDGRSVRLTVPDLKEGYVVYLRTDPESAEGEKMWSTEAWYTLIHKP